MIQNYITGANGFIGRALCGRLDHHVAIPHKAIGEHRYDECERMFFLSAYGNMAQHTSYNMMLQANIRDLASVLAAIKPTKDFLFVYVSSSSVNLKVQTPYSLTKRAGECMVMGSGFPCLIIRPYSITGVGEQPEHLIPVLIDAAFTGKKVNLVMSACHDFVDIEDAIDCIMMAANSRTSGIIEVGKGVSVSNREVLDTVEVVTGKRVNVKPVDSLRAYDTTDWRCHDTKARDMGWEPRKSLKDSIREMADAYANSATKAMP